jgi:hypothetical protein
MTKTSPITSISTFVAGAALALYGLALIVNVVIGG